VEKADNLCEIARLRTYHTSDQWTGRLDLKLKVTWQ